MPDKKKETKKKETPKVEYVTMNDLSNLYIIIKEIQENLDYINDRLERCMVRIGVDK